MRIIKFSRTVGEIPEGSLGILRIGLDGRTDYTRVFVPRRFVGLNMEFIPCYEMPTDDGSWTEIQGSALTKQEIEELSELNEEIQTKEKLFIGPNVLIKTMGIE